jgi:hypothetical protein
MNPSDPPENSESHAEGRSTSTPRPILRRALEDLELAHGGGGDGGDKEGGGGGGDDGDDRPDDEDLIALWRAVPAPVRDALLLGRKVAEISRDTFTRLSAALEEIGVVGEGPIVLDANGYLRVGDEVFVPEDDFISAVELIAALEAWMTERGLSVARVAKRLRVSGTTLRRWLAYTGRPSPTNVRRIARLIGDGGVE